MYITAIAAISLDGRITRGSDPDVRKWTSDEDKEHYREVSRQFQLIAMGARTYETMRSSLSPRNNVHYIVLCTDPTKYSNDSNPAFEFVDSTAAQLVNDMAKRGYTSMLIVGGASVYEQFLDAGLVDRLLITVEPLVFGKGLHFTNDKTLLNSHFKIASTTNLNDKGTILIEYTKI